MKFLKRNSTWQTKWCKSHKGQKHRYRSSYEYELPLKVLWFYIDFNFWPLVFLPQEAYIMVCFDVHLCKWKFSFIKDKSCIWQWIIIWIEISIIFYWFKRLTNTILESEYLYSDLTDNKRFAWEKYSDQSKWFGTRLRPITFVGLVRHSRAQCIIDV
jgi:hypothetical protein